MQKNQKGFTLVELAIVLMIIGLLIGGVLRGREMIFNAQANATARATTSILVAMHTFIDRYGSLPGDMRLATARIPNCTAATFCADGNGDERLNPTLPLDAAENQAWHHVPNGIATENTQFWKHLAAASMLGGINPAAGTPEWGQSHPTAPTGGGFFARWTNGQGTGQANSMRTGHVLVLRGPISGQWLCGGGGSGSTTATCALSPRQASYIDRKLDDGNSNEGFTRAVSANWMSGCGIPSQGINGPNGYAEGEDRLVCDMMFEIN